MPPRTKNTAKSKASKPKAKPARRPARAAGRKAKSQKQQPLLLEPIPDDAVVKYVVPLLGLDGLVQLMASAKTLHARLGSVKTPEGKAARMVVVEAYGVSVPVDADVLDWAKRLHRWTRHQRVSDELDLDLAKAFSYGTIRQGCEDELFFESCQGMDSFAAALAKSATWLVCEKKYAPRDEEDDEIVFRDVRAGEAVPETLGEVVQGVHSRVRLNGRVTADLAASMNYGDESGGATFDWSLRVVITSGGRPSKGSQRAEGLAHCSAWDPDGYLDIKYGEPLWCGHIGYGDAGGDPPDGREIHRGCAARLIAALGMPRQTEESHLMGMLLYILAAPFRWQCASDAVGPALEYRDEANTMLEVIRHQVLLACEWEEGDEDGWDDDERHSSFGKPPEPLCRYRFPAEDHRTGLWWLGKDPPSEDDFEPPPHSGGGSSDDDDEDDSDSDSD